MHPLNAEKLRNRELRNEARPFGYAIVAPGLISEEDARIWFEDLKALVAGVGRESFGLLVDIRKQRANPAGATRIIQNAMIWLRKNGCERSAVAHPSPHACALPRASLHPIRFPMRLPIPLRLRVALIALAVLLAGASSLPAQSDTLDTLIRTNAHRLEYRSGQLRGPGRDVLRSALDSVQFVAVGEWHNRRGVHGFTGALFRLLVERFGFQYFATEEGPALGEMISRAARAGGRDSVLALGLRYPNAFHLYTESGLELFGDAGSASRASANPIWGLNQEFGASHVLERLLELSPTPSARTVAERLHRQALAYEGERFRRNIAYVGGIATADTFALLGRAFAASPGTEAHRLIGQLEFSARIFAPYYVRPRPATSAFYQSGMAREANMKHLFADRYREALAAGDSLPKVVAFFGHVHLYRGMSERTSLFTLGNFLSEFAAYNGLLSYHVYLAPALPELDRGWQAPLMKAAAEAAGTSDAVLIDLKPLQRHYARREDLLSPEMRRLIFGYDSFVWLRETELGLLDRLRTPGFRLFPTPE
jgi:hypothetical protein